MIAQAAFAQNESGPDLSIELVDPKVLRVCADPRNLPFSNEAGEGFENKLAEMLARKLGKSLAYTFYPGATGFIRNTLNAHKCDVVMGYPQGDDFVQPTNPYYRTAYVLIARKDAGLGGLESLQDPRLRGKKIGIIAGTPPATNLAVNGLLPSIHSYPLVIDTRFDSSTDKMFKDLQAGEIDVAILWGPIGGYFVKNSKADLDVIPLVHEKSGPRMAYRIGMGVRHSDQNWKRELNRFISENHGAINRLLASYGVPLLDEQDKPIQVEP
ncbi:MAG TPA: substrate-binding domain-containing protein [Beijerinckiaceae bacterium]|nr:substrate-binding domain-containing protein [Beijerinckiaceae bacterium]